MFDGVEELDAVGPFEVFAAWSHHWPDDGWDVTTLSTLGAPVRCAKGLVLDPHEAAAGAEPLDVLVHPGGRGTRPLLADDAHLDWVRAQRAAAPLLASVCTGALVFGAAGLLGGRPATTHWAALDELRAVDLTIDVRADVRYVDDGDVITSAGVSAGIDMALHVVARLAGEARSRDVRRAIQYDPMPPV